MFPSDQILTMHQLLFNSHNNRRCTVSHTTRINHAPAVVGLNMFISFYNYTSIQTCMLMIQAMGLERKLKAY